MVFNSLAFLLFFMAVLGLHRLPLPWAVKKVNLLLASYAFYAAWNPPFVLLLVLTALVDFSLAKQIHLTRAKRWRRLLLLISLGLNLGLLAYFKYGGFLMDNVDHLFALVGVRFQGAAPSVVLPLGISFYTFETISYLVDVYVGRTKPWDSFLDYALFLTFFPHLVAGPIVRANDFLPQCAAPHQATSTQVGWGLCLLVIGLFEKCVLADQAFGPVADRVFNAPHPGRFLDAWVGTFAFAGQIFFDFAGYSTCGIGAALCLGFVLKDNFRFPYASVGFSDFWQRWHISLSSWLRDYLYIPLGGNREGALRTQANLFVTMLLGGLWHGASWHFVAWGGLHGGYLIGERLLKQRWNWSGDRGGTATRLGLALVTFGLVCVTWVFFRAQTVTQAFQFITVMAVPATEVALLTRSNLILIPLLTLGLFGSQFLLRDTTLEEVVAHLPPWGRVLGLCVLLICLALLPGEDRAFIYFQF